MTAAALVDFATWWLIIGAIVAAAFLAFGMDRIDEDAQDAYVFRPLLIPGILLIWPLVLWRWLRLERQSDAWQARYRPPRAIHLPVAVIFALALVIAMVAGLGIRQTWPADIAPQQLSEPGQ